MCENDTTRDKFLDIDYYLKSKYNFGVRIDLVPENEEWEIFNASKFLEKRRILCEAGKNLEKQRDIFETRMKKLSNRRKDLIRKQSLLKESIQQFTKFLKENELKTIRYKRKAAEERAVQKIKEDDIGRLRDVIDLLLIKRERLQKLLVKHSTARLYLDLVVAFVPEFTQVLDVISRYETLMLVLKELLDKESKFQNYVEEEKIKLLQFTEDKHTEMLNYNNKLAELQTLYDVIQRELIKNDAQWTTIKNGMAQKILILGIVKMSISNLYRLIRSQKKSVQSYREAPIEDPFVQLKEIKKYVLDWQEVLEVLESDAAVETNVPTVGFTET